MRRLLRCHICKERLQAHPLYKYNVGKTCPEHGDFFVYVDGDGEHQIAFKAFDSEAPVFLTNKKERLSQAKTPVHKRPIPSRRRQRIPVRCDQNGFIYRSQTVAAVALGVGQSDISNHLKGLKLTVNGYTFTEFVSNDTGGYSPKPRPVLPRNETRFPIAIRCDQTGQIFSSIREASRVLDIPKTTIRYRLRNSVLYKTRFDLSFSEVA